LVEGNDIASWHGLHTRVSLVHLSIEVDTLEHVPIDLEMDNAFRRLIGILMHHRLNELEARLARNSRNEMRNVEREMFISPMGYLTDHKLTIDASYPWRHAIDEARKEAYKYSGSEMKMGRMPQWVR